MISHLKPCGGRQYTAEILQAGESPITGRIYSIEQLRDTFACIEKSDQDPSVTIGAPMVDSDRLIGQFPSRDFLELSLGRASHRVIQYQLNQVTGILSATIELLENTPSGLLAKELIEKNVHLGLNPIMTGFVNDDHTVSQLEYIGLDINPFVRDQPTAVGSINPKSSQRFEA